MRALQAHSQIASNKTIKAWQRQISALEGELLAAVSKDTGRSLDESYLYDWLPLESTFDFLLEKLEDFAEPRHSSSALPWVLGSREIQKRRIPLGKILIVGTWNFPISLHLNQIITALAAGNKVTFKGSPWAPSFTAVLEKHGPKIFGEENFSVWHAENETVIKSLEDGNYQGLIFTGGTGAAKIYAVACAKSFTKCTLEASGSEAALVHSSSLKTPKERHQLLDHLMWGLLHYTGQTCVAPRFWFFPKDQIDAAWNELQKIFSQNSALYSGRAPLRHDGVKSEFANWCDWASKLKDVKNFSPSEQHPAKFYKLESLSDLSVDTPSSFGPGAIFVPYEHWNDAIHWINQSPWSLMPQSYYRSLSKEEWSALSNIEATSVSIGESIVCVGDAGYPFGGQRNSGTGLTHGIEGLEDLTKVQCFAEINSRPGLNKYTRPTWSNLVNLPKQVALLKKVKSIFG